MYPAEFDYRRANTIEEALSLMSSEEEAKFLAGGHSLIPLMKFRLATPPVLIDIGRLKELSYISDMGSYVAIGALCRHHDLEVSELLAKHVPILSHVAGTVGDPSVRHRGTIGGSVVHGDGASDLPAALLALDATFVVRSLSGDREVAATEFFLGFLETAIAPNELLVEIRVPKTNSAWSFQKFNRRAQDWAIVGVAAVKNGSTKIALVNMGSTPVRATATEAAIARGASIEEAADCAADGLEPPSDLNASSDYRRHLAHVLVRRALSEMGS